MRPVPGWVPGTVIPAVPVPVAGTGFPGVFYLKNHLYRNSFPVYALARYANQARGGEEYVVMKFQPSEFRLRSGF